MEDYCSSVFSSNITMAKYDCRNNLYDLLNIEPAKPLKQNDVKNYNCDYTPKTDKYYIWKRKSRLKVRTVRDIRKSFEQDVYTHLFSDLETQQNVLLKKIRYGSSGDENTKQMAKKMLRGDMPMSRSIWQMLINLNPEQHPRPRQFVLWDGRYIQVTGCRGGSTKLICNYDLAHSKLSSQNQKTSPKQKLLYKKKGLLRNSLVVKFKPGPLSKKLFLDDSYQKRHVGNVELVDIPKPGLDIEPKYGTSLEPTIVNFLNNLCKKDGIISKKWAEFAVSALGKVEKSNFVPLSRDCVTFELYYKYNQNRLLMRRDTDSNFSTSQVIKPVLETANCNIETITFTERLQIADMLDKIISAVEINILQDKLFTEDIQELRQIVPEDSVPGDIVTHVKDKSKRKFSELDRLDVTVIRLPETEDSYVRKSCRKTHCLLGCICASLEGTYNYRQHCGRIECMFHCTCDFPQSYGHDFLHTSCTDAISGTFDLNNKINLKLAKEEQKFHQTVIVTGKKRILLKGEERNWKTSKKYADFYSNMSLKNQNQIKQNLSILTLKLDCNNIEPWCMVHNLYRCFCKGKFTEICVPVSNDTVVKEPSHKDTFIECLETNVKDSNEDRKHKGCVQPGIVCEDVCSVKTSKILERSDSKPNKERQTPKSLDEPMSSSNIFEFNNCDNETVQDINKLHETRHNLDNEKKKITSGTITRHSSRILNKVNSSNNKHKKTVKNSESESSDYSDLFDNYSLCSRATPYEGRKYSEGYYKNTNYKILEMEKNDKRLQERLAALSKTTSQQTTSQQITSQQTTSQQTTTRNNSSEENNTVKPTVKTTNVTTSLLELLNDVNEVPGSKNSDEEMSSCNPKRKRLSSETKLVAWLESNYKLYKKRNDQGLFKNALDPPIPGRVALYSWEFVLDRYRERKNLFLVSKQKPFRIFMAVDIRNHFFDNCMNINEIRFANLHEYPQTVKNLLINATDLKDNFCILRALTCCWELIGSVTKVSESNQRSVEKEHTPEINTDSNELNNESSLSSESETDRFIVNKQNDTPNLNLPVEEMKQTVAQTPFSVEKESTPEDAGSSKWFVMTIEKDFSEIRFFKKGFFVKSDTIINAIHVARLSGKTVRLSSKKCIEQSEIPQFGIYAIPNNNEYCVFVGPYEMEDTLGIETIKTILDVRKVKRTRGFWITTNKVDNLKVVEDPLSFVPTTNARKNNAIPLETNFSSNEDINKDELSKSDTQEKLVTNKINESKESSPTKKEMKIVKPIKIRKTNGFYHLATGGLFKKISLPYSQIMSNVRPMVLKTPSNDTKNKIFEQNTATTSAGLNCVSETLQEKDIAANPEAVTQIKISNVFSQNDSLEQMAKHEKGMFILKPEEINRKLLQSRLISETCTSVTESIVDYDDGAAKCNIIESDADSRSNISTGYGTLHDDIYIISDDDTTNNEPINNYNIWKNVWIVCTNISNLGWIAGIKNIDNLLSFKFPGCEYSEFYTEEEAFTKINTELLKKIDTAQHLIPQWKVTESSDELEGQEMDAEHLYPDYVESLEGQGDPRIEED